MMTHILAEELGPQGITADAVAPGPVATRLFLDDETDEQVAQLNGMIPLGRLAQPDGIAAAAATLVGPDGNRIADQVIRADGGPI